MLTMNVIHMIESVPLEENVIIEYVRFSGDNLRFNASDIPPELEQMKVSYIETEKQENGSTAILFTVYEH